MELSYFPCIMDVDVMLWEPETDIDRRSSSFLSPLNRPFLIQRFRAYVPLRFEVPSLPVFAVAFLPSMRYLDARTWIYRSSWIRDDLVVFFFFSFSVSFSRFIYLSFIFTVSWDFVDFRLGR